MEESRVLCWICGMRYDEESLTDGGESSNKRGKFIDASAEIN